MAANGATIAEGVKVMDELAYKHLCVVLFVVCVREPARHMIDTGAAGHPTPHDPSYFYERYPWHPPPSKTPPAGLAGQR